MKDRINHFCSLCAESRACYGACPGVEFAQVRGMPGCFVRAENRMGSIDPGTGNISENEEKEREFAQAGGAGYGNQAAPPAI